MAKKQKIQLQQPQDLEAIDAELAAAMGALDEKNDEVTGLLAEFAPPPPPPETAIPGQIGALGSATSEPLPVDNPEFP